MSNKTKLSAKEFIDQYPKAIPEKRVDWEGAMVDYANYCLNFPTIPQGEPKTDEERVNEIKYSENELGNILLDNFEDGINALTDLQNFLLEKFIFILASERAQIIAEKYEKSDEAEIQSNEFYLRGFKDGSTYNPVEIPQCLQGCDLTLKELSECAIGNGPVEAIGEAKKIIFEKFSLLLSQVKGLPSDDDIDNFFKQWVIKKGYDADAIESNETKLSYGDMEDLIADGPFWIREQASLLLLQRDEDHKAEVERLKDFAEWAQLKSWRYLPEKGADKSKPWHNSLNSHYDGISTSELFDLFLKEKEGRNV